MRVLIFLVISGLAHFLAARWLLSTMSPAARARRRRTILFGAAALSGLLVFGRLIAAFQGTSLSRTLVAAFMLELGAVLIALLPIGLMTLTTRSVERAAGLLSRSPKSDAEAPAVEPLESRSS